MKRFDQMNEQELMEARASMTAEEIKAVMKKEEAELERIVKAAPIMESSIAEEEKEDDSIVNFNPETNEAIEVESTVVTRESEEPRSTKAHKSMVTLTDMQQDFGYLDGLLITKALKRMVERREQQEKDLRELRSKHHNNPKLSHTLEKMGEDLWTEERLLKNVTYVRDHRVNILGDTLPSLADRHFNEEGSSKTLRERVEALPKELVDELSQETYKLAEDLLDIL